MRSQSYLATSLLAAALLSGGLARAAEPPPRVGVLVSTGVNLDEAAKVELSEQLGAALRAELVVDVTAGREVQRRLDPEAPGPACFIDAKCQANVAARLGADQLLVLVVVRLGARLQIEPTWIEVASGRAVVRDALVIDTGKDEVSEVFRAAAQQLLPEAKPRPAAPPPPLTTTTTTTIERRIYVSTATVTPTRGPPVAAWVSFGVAVASLGAGIGLGVSANRDFDALDAEGCRNRPCDPSRIDGVDDKALAADILFGLAGAAVVTGALLWWLDEPEPVITTGPTAGSDGAGWMVRGRF